MRPEHPLTLAALDEFDPRAPARGRERDFCCPLCGREKRVDAAHRSLSLNSDTGAWKCHRCGVSGQLKEFWSEREAAITPHPKRRVRRLGIKLPPTREPEPEQVEGLAEKLAGCRDLLGSRGEQYLLSRGLNLSLAARLGVKFHPSWDRRAAVVFPLTDRAGATVAAEARYLCVPDGRPKSGCRGPKSSGAFVTPGALEADLVALVEGPACALTLAAQGLPAIATMGTGLPDWLPRALAWRRVLLASDADAAGDAAAEEWGAALRAFGARVERFRPEGAKDWNDLLQSDPEGLARQLEALGLEAPAPSSGTPPAPVAGGDGWALLKTRGWLRLESRLLGEVVLLTRDAEAPIPPRYAGLPRYTLADAARFLGDPEGLAHWHRGQQAAADRELLTGAPLRAEIGHLFAGVAGES